jgi:hypothetical protein
MVYGKRLTIKTDHKPLETIFKKNLHAALPRLQRIMFDVIRYDPKIVYKKTTELHNANTLNRVSILRPKDLVEVSDIEVQIVSCMTKRDRQKYRTATANDEEMQVLMQFRDWRVSRWHQAVFQLQGTNGLL